MEDVMQTETVREGFCSRAVPAAHIVLRTDNTRAADLTFFLMRTFPDFSDCLRSSLFKDERNGEISIHGVFAEFSAYFRENIYKMNKTQLEKLFNRLEQTFAVTDEVTTAVCTCFFENIAGEGLGEIVGQYIGSAGNAYFQKWGG